VQMTMNLISCNARDFKGLDSTHRPHRSCRSHAPDTQPQEPIQVQVRVRQYADELPDVRQQRSGNPDIGRMPVGTMLDCCM
jgi:hypothetical protein